MNLAYSLIAAPILLPLLTAALMLMLGEKRRPLKARINLFSTLLGLGLSVRPGSLLRSLTHDEPPVRPRPLSETGPDLGSDSYSSLGAATSPSLGLRSGSGSDSWLPDSFFGSLVSQPTSTSDLPAGAGARGRRDCALETEA